MDPQQAFLSSPPVFQTVTNATTYVYGPADPLFLSGKNYAWRVQAKAKQGLEEVGLFENQGYSEIYSFSYAGSCDLPLGINHEVKGSSIANIFWDDFSTDVPEYTLRYRQKNVEGAEWFTNKTSGNQTTLWDLKPGTVYEYQVQKQCAVTGSDWSIAKQFTTFIADEEAAVYDCNITPNFNLSNKEPLPNLYAGDTFKAGDFPIKVLETSGSNGRFTGKGYVTIPYLNSIRVGVAFTNVLVNTDNQLVEGSVVTVYDPSLRNILDIDDAVDTVTDAVDAVGEFVESISDLLADFKGTEEQIQELERYNLEQNNEIETLLNNQNISDELKEELQTRQEIYNNASNTMLADASTNGEDESRYDSMAGQILQTYEDLNETKQKIEDELKISPFISRKIKELSEQTGLTYYAILHCQECEDSNSQPKSPEYIPLNDIPSLSTIEEYITGQNGLTEGLRIELVVKPNLTNISKCMIIFYTDGSSAVSIEDMASNPNESIDYSQKLLFSNGVDTTDCSSSLNASWANLICDFTIQSFNSESSNTTNYFNGLFGALINCLPNVQGYISNQLVQSEIESLLKGIQDDFRNGQHIEFAQNGNVYHLDNGVLVKNPNALSLADLNNGNWTDGDEVKIRFCKESDGTIKPCALGIKASLANRDGKSIDNLSLAEDMKEGFTQLLKDYKVTNLQKTLSQSGYTINDLQYPDDKSFQINTEVRWSRFMGEITGITTEFLKTTEIEQPVYIDDYDAQIQVVRAPAILSGTVEGTAKEVTEITSMVVMIFDLATKEEIRKQTVEGFVTIKNQILEEPSTLFPMVVDIAIEEATGLTGENYSELDITMGRGQHLATKGTVRTTATIIAGGKFLAELPEIAQKLAKKLSRQKILRSLKDLGWTDEYLKKFVDDFSSDALSEILTNASKARKIELAESWKTIRDATNPNDLTKTTEYAIDPNTVKKVADYLSPNNANKLNAIGGIDELKNFIKANGDVPCATCTSGKPIFNGRGLDEMIENFIEVGHAFRNHPELWSKLKSGADHPLAAIREGTQHTFKVLKDNLSKYAPEKIEGIDLRFENTLSDIDNCNLCRYDVKLKQGNKPRMLEFKSYASDTWSGIATNQKFITQFKEYLKSADINKIDDLAYIFNPGKVDIAEVKQAFKNLLTDEADNILKPINQGGLGIDRVKQLFGNDITDVEDFLDKINNVTNNTIYDFINPN